MLLILSAAAVFRFEFASASQAPPASVEHVRGIYLQRAIEVATVGARTIYLTRMTRFVRCGRLRGMADDFNEHVVDVAGRDVPGIGFVAGLVDAIDRCGRQDAMPHQRRSITGASRD